MLSGRRTDQEDTIQSHRGREITTKTQSCAKCPSLYNNWYCSTNGQYCMQLCLCVFSSCFHHTV